jgi:predicted amidophosphoribosyltransferase
MAQVKSCEGNSDLSVECPCCGARLTIDAKLCRVVSYEAPPPKRSALDLDQAAALLKEQAERREAIFKQSKEDMKIQSQLLERKFAAALEKSKDEPVKKPTRDIDLD